jgi:hypothetical protein
MASVSVGEQLRAVWRQASGMAGAEDEFERRFGS